MKPAVFQFGSIVFFAVTFLCPLQTIVAGESVRLSTGVAVPVIQTISFTPHSFIFPNVSSTHLNKGFIEARNATTVTVSSNVPWQLTVRSEDRNMGQVKDHVKPLSDILWRKSGRTQYTAISTDDRLVDSSATYADHQKIELDYKMLVGWTRDKPGTYGLTLRYTLSTLE